MQINVKLFASLARFSPGGLPGTTFRMDLPDSCVILDVVEKLGIPSEEIRVAFVNGVIHEMDWVLQPEDEVGIFPPIGGG